MNVGGRSGFSLSLPLVTLLVAGAIPGHAQKMLSRDGSHGQIHVYPTDMAIFEAGESRKDMACEVTNNKPVLGFDLRFHHGYEVKLPLREVVGTENLLTILFR